MNNFPEYKYDLSLEHDGSSRFIIWIMACFIFIATLSMYASMAADSMVNDWQAYAVNQATIEIPYSENSEEEGLQLAEQLAPLKITDSVEIIPPEETSALVRDAISTPDNADDDALVNLPLPLLVNIVFNDRMSEEDFQNLSNIVTGINEDIQIHRHEEWASDILDYGQVLKGGALLLLILMIAMTVLTLIWTLVSRVNVHHDEIVILNTIGADDVYISRQFQHFALGGTLKGCLIGLITALIVLVAVNFKLDLTTNIPGFSWTNILAWSGVPLIGCLLISWLTARITLYRTFAKL